MLQSLHEQLNVEYDSLSKEREILKVNLRDTRTEKRNLHDKYQQMKSALAALEAEKENLLKDSQTLVNLRTEHSKLKVRFENLILSIRSLVTNSIFLHFFQDDFRSLFQASEKLKSDYRNLQEEYRRVHSDASKMKLLVAELQSELTTNTEKLSLSELEISKLNNRCDVNYPFSLIFCPENCHTVMECILMIFFVSFP